MISTKTHQPETKAPFGGFRDSEPHSHDLSEQFVGNELSDSETKALSSMIECLKMPEFERYIKAADAAKESLIKQFVNLKVSDKELFLMQVVVIKEKLRTIFFLKSAIEKDITQERLTKKK